MDGSRKQESPTEEEVEAAWVRHIDDSIAAYWATFTALRRDLVLTLAQPTYEENPDPFIGFASGPPPESRVVAGWRRSRFAIAAGPHGAANRNLFQGWLVLLCEQWESTWRPRFASVKGFPTSRDLKIPVMGDLRLMRNDIVHHYGVATTENTGRCTVLTRFASGDVILWEELDFFQFYDAAPWPIGRFPH